MYLRLSRLTGRIAVIVLLGAAVSVTGVRTAQAEALVVPQDGYGFRIGGAMTWMSDVDADRELDAAAQTGATWMRSSSTGAESNHAGRVQLGVMSITGSMAR